jgi:uncharacterized protein (TIGR02996 family)
LRSNSTRRTSSLIATLQYPFVDALEDAIVAAPNDAGRYAVFADALMQRGDPRGELIALELKLASVKDTGEFARLKAKQPELFARVAAELLGKVPAGFEVKWKWGFVQRVSCESDDVRTLRDLLHRPAMRALQAVRFTRGVALAERMGALMDAQPRALRGLELVGGTLDGATTARVLGAFGAIEHLLLYGDELQPALLALPELKTLELAVLAPPPELADRLEAAPWPQLRKLTVAAPELPVRHLLPALALPKLTQVRLEVHDCGPVLEAIAARANLRQVTELLLHGLVTDAHLAPLRRREHELEALKLTLPARGLTVDTVLWLRQHVKLQLLNATGVPSAFEQVRTAWRGELG